MPIWNTRFLVHKFHRSQYQKEDKDKMLVYKYFILVKPGITREVPIVVPL